MSQWYEHQKDHGNHLWLYSERGWMSFLFWHVLADDLNFVLKNATNQDGERLEDVIGAFQSHATLTEHELGPQGFGTPDGAFMTVAPGRRHFVFVEAKQGSFQDSYRSPEPKTAEDLSAPALDIDRLCAGNKFNSSINGQLELRWRFVNALRASAGAGAQVVSERHVRVLPPALMSGDRFYWRLALHPDPNVTGHWRRVDMSGDLHRLYETFVQADDFHLLSITFDDRPPDFRRHVRLYGDDGSPQDAGKKVFWLNRSLIEDMLVRL